MGPKHDMYVFPFVVWLNFNVFVLFLKCSVTCGVGVQRRYIYCGSIAENLNPSECSEPTPDTTKVCSQPECGRGEYKL
jgi:hypothetical protein